MVFFLTSGLTLNGVTAESKKNQETKLSIWWLVMYELKNVRLKKHWKKEYKNIRKRIGGKCAGNEKS